jgi:Sigma-70, region 4
VLASLTPREERVLRIRLGIGMNTDHTLAEVGQQFSVSASAFGKSRPRPCASLGTRAEAASYTVSSTIEKLLHSLLRVDILTAP